MRYGGPRLLSVASLAQGIATPSFVAAFVPTTRSSHSRPTGRSAACIVAVALATVTSAADVERFVAPDAVRSAVAVVVSLRNRNLPPGGTGRAALGRGDFCWIPASLLKGDRGETFRDGPPWPPLPRGWGLLFPGAPRHQPLAVPASTRYLRPRLRRGNQSQAVASPGETRSITSDRVDAGNLTSETRGGAQSVAELNSGVPRSHRVPSIATTTGVWRNRVVVNKRMTEAPPAG